MPTLSYDFSIVGLSKVNQALAGLERRLAQHNTRAARLTGAESLGPGASRGGPYRSAPARMLADQDRNHQRMLIAERRFQEKLGRERDRARQKEVAQELRALKQAERARERSFRSQSRAASRQAALGGRIVGRAGSGVGRTLSAVGGLGAQALAIGGGFAFSNAINVEKQINARATALANQAVGTAGAGGKKFGELKAEALKVARTEGVRSGQGPEAVLGAMRQFQSISGRFDIGAKMATYMTELSDATDAGLEDVGKTAGQVFQSLMARMPQTAEGAQQAMDDTVKIMNVMAGQAKIGSIEFRDLATQMGSLMSATSGFEGDVTDLASKMGAIAQLAIAGGASSPAEAMTAIKRFRDDLISRGGAGATGAWSKMGIDVFNKQMVGGKEVRGSLRDPMQIMFDILEKTQGDLPKVKSLFGVRAMKAAEPFAELYRKSGGGKKGIDAIRQQYGAFSTANLTDKQRREAATATRSESGRKFDIALAQFNDAIGQKLLPKLTELVPTFTDMIPSIVKATEALIKLAEFAAKNPFTTLGAVFSGFLLKELAAAGISSMVQSALLPGFSAAGGGATSLAGSFGAASLAIGAAAAAVGLAADQAVKLYNEIGDEKKRVSGEQESLLKNAEAHGEKSVVRERGLWEKTFSPHDQWANPFDSQTERLSRGPGGKIVVKRNLEGTGEAPLSVPMSSSGGSKYDWSGVSQPQGEVGGKYDWSGVAEKSSAAAAKQDAAAAKIDSAAAKMAAAADKIAAAGLNRGNAPSPTTAR